MTHILALLSTYVSGVFWGLVLGTNLITFPFPNTSERWYVHWVMSRVGFLHKESRDSIYTYDKDLGWTLKKNLRNQPYAGSLVSTNSQGIRGTKEIEQNKTDTLRILLLGDSYTFGECVSDTQTYASYLENIIPNAEVINMGVSGYGTDQMLTKLERDGLTYKPDIVILGFFNDDLARNHLWFREYFKPLYEPMGTNYKVVNTPLPNPEGATISMTRLLSAIWKSNADTIKMLIDKDQNTQKNLDRSTWLIKQIIETTTSYGAKPYILYLPTKGDILKKASFHADPYDGMCQKPGVGCIDPTPDLVTLAKDKDIESLFSCHYAPEVHNRISQTIKTILVHDGYVR